MYCFVRQLEKTHRNASFQLSPLGLPVSSNLSAPVRQQLQELYKALRWQIVGSTKIRG